MDYLIYHLLNRSASLLPDKEAVADRHTRLTFSEAANKAKALADGLRDAGLRRGDRVGIYLENSVLQVLSIFGVSEAEGVFVPINALLFPPQVMHIARDCQMKALITTRQRLASLSAILIDVPSLEFVVVAGEGGSGQVRQSVYDLTDLLESGVAHYRQELSIGRDLAAILYTSGSTGRPKGVMLSHEQVIAGSSIVSDYLGISDADRIIGVLPLSFDAGLNQLMTAIHKSATYIPITFVFAREIVKTLQEEGITGMAGVPTLWSLMAQPNSGLEKNHLPELRYITNTGGRMPESVLNILRRLLPSTQIFLMYGLTEAFRSTYLPPNQLDKRPNSIGKAIPNTEILVVNDQGQPCKPGEIGELVHRGPTVSMGYWGQPELTAQVLRPHPFNSPEIGDPEKVCYSGDLVTMDEDGFLYFVGRRDNMIKSSGFRISPTEVEEVLFQSGMLREAAVIGVPDGTLGDIIKAYVAPRDGVSIDRDALLEFCGERMPRYMIPKTIQIMQSLPKAPNGKVDYPALRRSEGTYDR